MQQATRNRTLTTIGLPARKEQLLRSMLLAANAHTTDQWHFSDDMDADVAICDAHSMLSGVALARSRRDGRPACVWLATGDEAVPEGARLQDPIVTVRLIAVLDLLSSTLPAPRKDAGVRAPAGVIVGTVAGSAVTEPARRYDAPLLIRDLLERGTRDPFRLSVDGLEMHVVPGSRTICLPEPLSNAVVERLLKPGPAPRLQPMLSGQAIPAGHVVPVDAVLWSAGLAAGLEEPLLALPADGLYSLTRWPDFGRLRHDPSHVQMAAYLTRRPHAIAVLARAVRRTDVEVRAFVTACFLCGLIDIDLAPAKVAVAPPAAAFVAAGAGRARLFTSIRAALGIGRQ